MNELARRYAEALYDLSPDEEALRTTAQAMMADAALWESLRSPAVQAWEKARILARLPGLSGRGVLLRFYQLLASKGRMALLPDILEAFHDKALAQRGAARCRLTCVRVPGKQEQLKLRDRGPGKAPAGPAPPAAPAGCGLCGPPRPLPAGRLHAGDPGRDI